MSRFEFNKILAALILSFIVIFIINRLGNLINNPEETNLTQTAYKIDIPESDANTKVASSDIAADIEPITELLSIASLQNGEKIYGKCGSCHTYKKDGKSKIGPNLWNIVDSQKGSTSGFAYSSALVEFGGNWTYEDLNNFLYKPKEYIKGTKMNFAGLKKAQDRADLILWLRNNSENPIPLP